MTDPSYSARQAILKAILPIVAFDGWTAKSLTDAVAQTELPKGAGELYFPEGPLEVISFWSDEMNRRTEDKLAVLDQSDMKIRDKVTAGVLARMAGDRGYQHGRKLLFQTHNIIRRDRKYVGCLVVRWRV